MKRAEFTHTIAFDAEADRVFPMFTPLGELAWIPGWKPDFVSPENGKTGEGLVFTTGADAGKTYWNCLDWQPAERRVRYLKMTPASECAVLSVACRETGNACSEVTVSHVFTALTAAGETKLAAMTQRDYSDMIEGWRKMAKTWLDHHPGETVAA
jgi:hypothetical protein